MILDGCELKHFTSLSHDEKCMILAWRNHRDVRIWMRRQHIITKVQHFDFIEKLKKTTMHEYFLVTCKNRHIGVIYFNNIDHQRKEVEIGLYANPFIKNKNGSKLMMLILKYAFEKLKVDTIRLEVLRKNERAIHLYEKFGFAEIKNGRTDENSKTIYMKLQKKRLIA